MARGFACGICGERHEGFPDLAFRRPDAWLALSDEVREESFESDDGCVIREGDDVERCFVRCVLEVPIAGGGGVAPLGYGPWAEVAFEDLHRVMTGEPGVEIAPFDGVLATELPGFAGSLGLAVRIEPGDNSARPLMYVTDATHALAAAQGSGLAADAAAKIVHDALGEWE